MTKEDLKTKFPALYKAQEAFPGLPPLAETYLASLYPDHEYFHELQSMEAAVALLLKGRKPEELSSQVRGAFGTEAREWRAAISELLAFSLLEESKSLHEIGYPRGLGDTPPFDGTLLDAAGANRNSIPFDVKDTSNVGLYLLDKVFRRIADEWSDRNKLPRAEMEYKTKGPVTVKTVGQVSQDLAKELQTQLEKTTTFPPAPIVLTVHREVDAKTGLEIRPKITVSLEIRPSTGSGVSDLGVVRMTSKAASIEEVVKRHVETKAELASKYDCVFLIIYVRPPQSGMADLEPRGLQLALQKLDADMALLVNLDIKRWLGTVVFDWTPSEKPLRHGHLRPSALWPAGSTPETLSATLQLTAWN
jgi:hypothetical protein